MSAISFAQAVKLEGSAIFFATPQMKNRLLLAKYASIVDKAGSPDAVRVLSGMRFDSQRIMEAVAYSSPAALVPTVQTFHSFCENIVRRFASKLTGLTARTANFTVFGEDIVGASLRDLFPDAPSRIRKDITRVKLANFPEQKYLPKYAQFMHANNALDFDDLLVLARTLLSDHEDVRHFYRQQIPYVILTALEDVTLPQALVIQALAMPLQAARKGAARASPHGSAPPLTCIAMYEPYHARFELDREAVEVVHGVAGRSLAVKPDAAAAAKPEATLRLISEHFLDEHVPVPRSAIGAELTLPDAAGVEGHAAFIANELSALAANGVAASDILVVYLWSVADGAALRAALAGHGVECHSAVDPRPSPPEDFAVAVLGALCNARNTTALVALMQAVACDAEPGQASLPRARAAAAADVIQRTARALNTTPPLLLSQNLRMLAGASVPDAAALQPVFTAAIAAVERNAGMDEVVAGISLPGAEATVPADSPLRRAARMFDRTPALVDTAIMTTPVSPTAAATPSSPDPQSLSPGALARVLAFMQHRHMLSTLAEHDHHVVRRSVPLAPSYAAKGASVPFVFISVPPSALKTPTPRLRQTLSSVAAAATRRVYLPANSTDPHDPASMIVMQCLATAK